MDFDFTEKHINLDNLVWEERELSLRVHPDTKGAVQINGLAKEPQNILADAPNSYRDTYTYQPRTNTSVVSVVPDKQEQEPASCTASYGR